MNQRQTNPPVGATLLELLRSGEQTLSPTLLELLPFTLRKKRGRPPNPIPHKKLPVKAEARVTHATRGEGTVIEEWGSWDACRECFGEMPVSPRTNDRRFAPKICPHCRKTSSPIPCSGKGIFEVQFKNGVHAVNQCWLEADNEKLTDPTKLNRGGNE